MNCTQLTPQEEQPHLVVQPEPLQQLEQEQEGISILGEVEIWVIILMFVCR
jgi:hypothetical protein